jgi:outer membrane protein OmpA-like peptidoglycan-associated protein
MQNTPNENDLEQESGEDWLILSDLSMGGFIIFLIVAIAFIVQYNKVKQGIYDVLKEFDKKEMVEVLADGTVRFKGQKNKVLFLSGEDQLSQDFQKQLDIFLPAYFNAIDSFADKIAEIRIEGHTDTVCPAKINVNECYYYNIELSQRRAFNVLKFIFENSTSFKKLSQNKQKQINNLFVANGYGATRSLDAEGKYTFETKQPVDIDRSRRVDFKIMLKK